MFHGISTNQDAFTDYWYRMGVNWKAYAAYLMAIWPLCPGFAYQFNKNYNISQGWVNLYKIGWLFAVFMSASVYTVLGYLFKDPAMFEAQRHPWEIYAENQQHLLDKETDGGTVTMLQGSNVDETESDDSQKHLEKELDKAPGLVRMV
jgi:NCS1 family nucleobase:cation symporter-1